MDRERAWLEEHGRSRRVRDEADQRRRRLSADFASMFRRFVNILSVAIALLILVSLILNWNKLTLNWNKSGIAIQLIGSFACLLVINCFIWLIEWLLHHIARRN